MALVPAPVSAAATAEGEPVGTRHPPRMMNLRKVTTPILLHLVKGEVRFRRLFLLRCRLTVSQFKKRIDPQLPAELVDLAALPLWVYLNLRRRLGPAKAFEIIRIAILTGGVAQWNLAYKTVETERTFANLCDQELEVNRTGPTRWNTLEVVERTDRRFEIKIRRCLSHELAMSAGAPEITPVICQIDNAASTSLLREEEPGSMATSIESKGIGDDGRRARNARRTAGEGGPAVSAATQPSASQRRATVEVVLRELRAHNFAVLSTVEDDGAPGSAGVNYGVSAPGRDLALYVMTRRHLKKARNIAAEPARRAGGPAAAAPLPVRSAGHHPAARAGRDPRLDRPGGDGRLPALLDGPTDPRCLREVAPTGGDADLLPQDHARPSRAHVRGWVQRLGSPAADGGSGGDGPYSS